jgi:predicted membrane protein
MENTTTTHGRSGLGGGLIVLAGVWLLLDQLGVSTAGQYWPLFWVVAGVLIYLLSHRGRFMTIVAVMMVLGGGLAQLNSLGLTALTLDDVFWPVLLIMIGLSMFSSRPAITVFGAQGKTDDRSQKADYTSIFGGQERRVTSKDWRGGEATAVFGGLDLDLREAGLADGAQLEVAAIFGAVKIIVPKDINVDVSGLPIFGGIDDKSANGGTKTLQITATVVFGGLEITN